MDAAALSPKHGVCVLGGSVAGLVFARLLQERRPDDSLMILDEGGRGGGGKAIVVDRAAGACLQRLGALPAASSLPINKVRVSTFMKMGKTIGGDVPLGYGIALSEVQRALRADLPIHKSRICDIQTTPEAVVLTASDGAVIRSDYLVVACPFTLPPPFRTRRFPYQQSIFSMQATAALPPATAYQRFVRRRVLVLVPQAENQQTGVIICAPIGESGDISALSDAALSAYLSAQFDTEVRVHGRRFIYPPQLAATSPMAHGRIILLGSGASTLHPIGAQSISLAIADAQQLAAAFAQPQQYFPQPAIARYQRRRVFAHRRKALLTSALALGAF